MFSVPGINLYFISFYFTMTIVVWTSHIKGLEVCSIIQVRKSQKTDSVHLDVIFEMQHPNEQNQFSGSHIWKSQFWLMPNIFLKNFNKMRWAEVVQASHYNASWMAFWWRVLGMSTWEETTGESQSSLPDAGEIMYFGCLGNALLFPQKSWIQLTGSRSSRYVCLDCCLCQY